MDWDNVKKRKQNLTSAFCRFGEKHLSANANVNNALQEIMQDLKYRVL